MKSLEQRYLDYLNNNHYQEAKYLFNLIDTQKRKDFLVNIAFDSGSLVVYTFVCFLIAEKEESALHALASLILSHPLCYLDGAYAASFMHAFRAGELSPTDVSYKEALLFFYHVPEQILTSEEALEIIDSILLIDNQNICAKEEYRLVQHVQGTYLPASTFFDSISQGKFNLAKKVLENLTTTQDEQAAFLIKCAQSHPTLSIYTYIWFLLFDQETPLMHSCAATILVTRLKDMNGAAESAALHLKRASELSSSK